MPTRRISASVFIVIAAVLFMITALTGCEGEKKVVVASKPHAEQYILAEMLTLIIEDRTDISVEKQLGIGGGTANIQPGMESGEIDIYPEYTGTGWLFVLKEELVKNPDDLYRQVKEGYADEYDIIWLDRYGFNNTYAMAVDPDIAEKYQLETYSDLAEVSDQLVFGGEYDFYEREDGLPGLIDVYGFNFKDTKEIDIGLKYEAIGSGQVDVINAFSTDGLIKEYDLKVLDDDKYFFPSYQAATLIRGETLEEYPELEAVLNVMNGLISDNEMIELNYKVEKENEDPAATAREFLISKKIL
ncbi:MAG: glycine/betaine ABC transporter substrate-binding protein [Spirochaetia bacterium]|nr:glycine/betaine ABC transporter substrate-binding protein [Spirochaetia bacterium]